MNELINELYEENLREIFESDADPNGSYTGTSADGDDEIIQDADDL